MTEGGREPMIAQKVILITLLRCNKRRRAEKKEVEKILEDFITVQLRLMT